MINATRLGRLVALALCSALAAAPAALGASPATSSEYQSATTGIVERSPTPATTPAATPAPAAHQPNRGARRRHGSSSASALATSAPQASLAPVNSSPGSLRVNFNGVSSRDSALTNFGLEFEPPDQGLCVGNGFVVEMVNSAYTVYDTKGKVLAGPFNINGPFDEGLTEFTSDPRCYYDASTNTWFATILAINKGETESFVDIAVNTSGDPTTPWTAYKINSTDVGGKTGPRHKGCPCLGDQPTLGIDSQNLYITTNEFALASEQFNGAQIYAFAKKDLIKDKPLHYVHFDDLSLGGGLAASVQPAITTGTPAAEYFLSSIDPNETGGQQLGVWALSERQQVGRGGTPTLSATVIGSEPFSNPPPAEQKGSSTPIEAGDDRMQQTQYINGSVWGELDTKVYIPGEPSTRAGAAWFQVQPALRKGVISAAQIQRQGYVTQSADYVLYPALQVTPSGGATMVATLTRKALPQRRLHLARTRSEPSSHLCRWPPRQRQLCGRAGADRGP